MPTDMNTRSPHRFDASKPVSRVRRHNAVGLLQDLPGKILQVKSLREAGRSKQLASLCSFHPSGAAVTGDLIRRARDHLPPSIHTFHPHLRSTHSIRRRLNSFDIN